MTTPDLYAALDIPRDADAAAVHAAYRRTAKTAHPDAGGSADAALMETPDAP
ncbi:MAG: DnaJ domain-containing protein [Nitrospiraceae bacterium]|nr:DnaJ domain-containing protein [Nitrospiraceae bacterium]